MMDRENLTRKQIEFLETYTISPFIPEREVCASVGVTTKQLNQWKKGKRFNTAMQKAHNQTQKAANMSRKKVMDGMLEAIDLARILEKPTAMISGWKEVGRMCGFYEPDRKEITLNVQGAQLEKELKSLPREELYRLMEQHGESLDSIIEGEATVLESAENEPS